MALTNTSVVGNREDLKELATIITAENYPVSRLIMTEPIHDKRPRTLFDDLAAPKNNGHIEGNTTDAGANQFGDVAEFTGQAQREVREWEVSKEQQAEKSAVPATKEAASEKALKALIRDKELVLCGDQDATLDVPGTTAGKTHGLGALISNTAATGVPASFVTPASNIYSDTKANFTEEAMNAVLASIFNESGELIDFNMIVGTALRTKIVQDFTRAAGSGSRVDYNMNGTGTIPYTVEVFDSDFGQVKIQNGNPLCMPSVDRGYILDPSTISWGEFWGEGSEEYEGRGAGYLGACDWYGATLVRGLRNQGKIEFSDET